MGLTAAYHNCLNKKPNEFEFKTFAENNNNLKAAIENKAKSLIGDSSKFDQVNLTKVDFSSFEKYAKKMDEDDKNKLVSKFQDALKSVYDDFIDAINSADANEETPTVDPKTINEAAKDTTMIGDNKATTNDAEVDPMTAKIMEYAELDDRTLASKLNEINSAIAGLISFEESIEESLNNGTMSEDDFNKTLVSIYEQEENYEIEKEAIESAKVYKQEAKIIEKMTPEQKAELETVNKEMIAIEEKMLELFDKFVESNSKLLQDDISQEEYDLIKAESDELLKMYDNLRLEQLAPLQEKRQALFDNAGLELKTPETTEEPKLNLETVGLEPAPKLQSIEIVGNTLLGIGKASKGDTVSLGDLLSENIGKTNTSDTTDETKLKTLADKLKEEAKKTSLLGTTTSKTSNKNTTTSKTTSNIFTKIASDVKSEDLEGVLEAMKKKGLSETFTNATKVGDNAGVDFTRRQFRKATAGAGINEQVGSQEATDFQTKHMKKFKFNNRTLAR